MKDISIYFEPVEIEDNYQPSQLGAKIIDITKESADLEKNSIAIFFVNEYRNSDLTAHKNQFELLLDKLYLLEGGEWNSPIYFLGQINEGNSPNDTYAAVKDIINELVKNEVLPIVIGGSQDLTYPMFMGYQKLEQTVNLMSVDAEIDMGNPENEINHNSWLSKIIVQQPNFLFNFTNIGYQTYYNKKEELDLIEKMYFDAFRLGDFYSNEKMVEPLVRNADILSFDVNAIKSSDYKNNSKDSPHGFYGEDACKIMRYAGLSDKLTSIGVFNYTNTKENKSDANLIAQMIWYFIEGFNQRKNDYPKISKITYKMYRVVIDDFKDELVFYKSDKSGRWWIEVPYPNSKDLKFQRHLLTPCNYEEYQDALKNQIPNLWWKTYQKLL